MAKTPKSKQPVVVPVGAGWIAFIENPHNLQRRIIYGRDAAEHFPLNAALAHGLLRDVARARSHTQHDIADQLGIFPNTVARWWRAEAIPTGLYRRALEDYLLGHVDLEVARETQVKEN